MSSSTAVKRALLAAAEQLNAGQPMPIEQIVTVLIQGIGMIDEHERSFMNSLRVLAGIVKQSGGKLTLKRSTMLGLDLKSMLYRETDASGDEHFEIRGRPS